MGHLARGLEVAKARERGPAEPDFALAELAREIRHRDRDLVGAKPGEQLGEALDLGRARAHASDVARRGHELAELHAESVGTRGGPVKGAG